MAEQERPGTPARPSARDQRALWREERPLGAYPKRIYVRRTGSKYTKNQVSPNASPGEQGAFRAEIPMFRTPEADAPLPYENLNLSIT